MLSVLDSLKTEHRRFLMTIQMAGVMEYRPSVDAAVRQLVELDLLALSFDAKGRAQVRLTRRGDMIATRLVRGEAGLTSEL